MIERHRYGLSRPGKPTHCRRWRVRRIRRGLLIHLGRLRPQVGKPCAHKSGAMRRPQIRRQSGEVRAVLGVVRMTCDLSLRHFLRCSQGPRYARPRCPGGHRVSVLLRSGYVSLPWNQQPQWASTSCSGYVSVRRGEGSDVGASGPSAYLGESLPLDHGHEWEARHRECRKQ